MGRKGRKPQGTGHVERLEGSESAKQRLTTILQTLRGELTVPEACARLGICEARFHALRSAWLQDALESLEPRRLGRPPQAVEVGELLSRLQTLETENATLRQQLTAAEVRRELAEALPHVVRRLGSSRKKGGRPTQPPPRTVALRLNAAPLPGRQLPLASSSPTAHPRPPPTPPSP